MVSLVPLYRWYLHDKADEAVSSEHVRNAKRVLWSAYERILHDLYDVNDDREAFVEGFRYELCTELDIIDLRLL